METAEVNFRFFYNLSWWCPTSPQLISIYFSRSCGNLTTSLLLSNAHFVHNITWWAEETFTWDRYERLFSSSELHRLIILVMLTVKKSKNYSNFSHTKN